MTLGESTDLSNVAIYLNWKHFYGRYLVYILLFVTLSPNPPHRGVYDRRMFNLTNGCSSKNWLQILV